MADGISLSAFGRLLGVSPEAISKAVRRGRLSRSVGRDDKGRPVIVDSLLAEFEWQRGASKTRPAPPASKPAHIAGALIPDEMIGIDEEDGGLSLVHGPEDGARIAVIGPMSAETALIVGRWLCDCAADVIERRGVEG